MGSAYLNSEPIIFLFIACVIVMMVFVPLLIYFLLEIRKEDKQRRGTE
jgi:hypothetical protein